MRYWSTSSPTSTESPPAEPIANAAKPRAGFERQSGNSPRSLPHPVQRNICLCGNSFQLGGRLAGERGADGLVGAVHAEHVQHAFEEVRLDGAKCDVAVGGRIDAVAPEHAAVRAAVAHYLVLDSLARAGGGR